MGNSSRVTIPVMDLSAGFRQSFSRRATFSIIRSASTTFRGRAVSISSVMVVVFMRGLYPIGCAVSRGKGGKREGGNTPPPGHHHVFQMLSNRPHSSRASRFTALPVASTEAQLSESMRCPVLGIAFMQAEPSVSAIALPLIGSTKNRNTSRPRAFTTCTSSVVEPGRTPITFSVWPVLIRSDTPVCCGLLK